MCDVLQTPFRSSSDIIRVVFQCEIDFRLGNRDEQFKYARSPFARCVVTEKLQASVQLFRLLGIEFKEIERAQPVLLCFSQIVDRIFTRKIASEDASLFDRRCELRKLSLRRRNRRLLL